LIERTYKSAVGIRGDCLYCPLPLSIDGYWNCEPNCHHCPFRRLNRTWGEDLRPADPDAVAKKLENGLKNKNPKSSLAYALKLKKTIRIGSRTDPFQPAELRYGVVKEIIKTLIKLDWSFIIQTRFLHNMIEYDSLLEKARKKNLVTILPIISPGLEWDQQELERGITTGIRHRGKIIKKLLSRDFPLGVNGEPFIPGLHTVEMFAETIDWLKNIGVRSYNTYNLHLNDDVAKKLHAIGLDIEKIWVGNQDDQWRDIHHQLCHVAMSKGMKLGCPDFVNTVWGWKEKANTCCGVNVPNPSRFNAHNWKHLIQKGKTPKQAYKKTWEGIGDPEIARKILKGEKCEFYTIKEIVDENHG